MIRKCSRCDGNEFRRVNRLGFYERQILPLFGLYPWECALCRRRTFLRSDGHKTNRPADQPKR